MRPIDDLRRQGPANAFVNAASHSIILGRRIEVESPLLAPVAHDRQTVEQQDAALLRDPAHDVRVCSDAEHGFGARTILHVHHDHIGIGGRDRVETLVETGVEILGFDAVQASIVPACQITSAGLSSARILCKPAAISAVVSRG